MGRRRPVGRAAAAIAVGGAAACLGYRAARGRGDDLRGEVVLITGGSRGLGLLLAREFAKQGCRIVICARDEVELAHAESILRAEGVTCLAIRCDVGRRAEVEAMVARATDRFGRVDIVVNNAGIIQVGPLRSMDVTDFRRAMDVMFWGTVHTTLAVLPQMTDRRHGRIVNVTSIDGRVSFPHLLPYNAAKHAQVGLSEGLRAELGKDGIRVTTIIPGLMRTGSPVNALFKGDREKEFSWFSLGSATPITAISAGRAARRIVEATRRGEAQVTISWQAKLLRTAHDLLPGPTGAVLAGIARLLPSGTDPEERRGMELTSPIVPSPITMLMNRAARRNNEFGGSHTPSRDHARRMGLNGR